MASTPARPGDAVDPAIMAARYPQPSPRTRRRRLVLGAAVLVLTLAALVALQLVGLGRTTVTAQHVGYTVLDAGHTAVRFTVITDPGTTVRCTLVAVNSTFAQVGFTEVTIGPVAERMTSQEEVVATTEPAASGTVQACRALPE